jgi:3-oxoacyl-[acyl-carrier protein] reductase
VYQFGLDGRVAVVTGAASGIGRATAIALREAGADVVVADVDEAGLHSTAASVGGVRAVVTDVSERSQVQALVQAAVDRYGRLDVMANVAGIIRRSALVDLTEDELDLVLAVNLKGVLFGCQAAIPVMAAAGGGSIINMASAAIDQPPTGIAAYAISKAGVAMVTKVAAREAAASRVRVNAVAPGYIVTPMTQRGLDTAEMVDRIAAHTPLGRVGQPGDIANAVVYLASDASSWMTGQVLRPNGGVAMPW